MSASTLLTKQKLGWPTEPPFYIPEQAREHFREAIERGKLAETEWRDKFSAYARAFPDLAKAFQQFVRGELPDGWDRDIPVFPADAKGLATRVAAGQVMNAVASRLPALIGGSADLNPSTHTALSGLGDFEPIGMNACDKHGAVDGVWGYAGRYLYFGVREHERHSDSERFGGRPDHGGSTNAARSKCPGARRLHAKLGIVRRSAAELSRPGVVAVNPGATCRRSGRIATSVTTVMCSA